MAWSGTMDQWMCSILFILSFVIRSLSKEVHQGAYDVTSITFLVTVNDTYEWIPPFDNSSYACMVTANSIPLSPNTPLNKSVSFDIGNCDSGSLAYTVHSHQEGKATVVATFQSTRYEYSPTRTCIIEWNYSYRLPAHAIGSGSMNPAEESLLPGCFTTASGGPQNYHTMDYWFYILEWDIAPKAHTSYSSDVPVASVTFLVAVNQTKTDCLMTTKTPPIKRGVLHNKTGYIHVGKCDYGALDFNVFSRSGESGAVHTYIDLIFHSHDIAKDAGPPTCSIQWDYHYRVPLQNNQDSSLLPGCYTAVSREGFHMTYYWFYVLDWNFEK